MENSAFCGPKRGAILEHLEGLVNPLNLFHFQDKSL